MLFLLGVLFMVVGIGASIALHEIGHMAPAKKFGVRVPQYMIGFGPTLWSRRGKETEYGIKAIPLGGYVRMIGMYPPGKNDPEGSVRASSTGRFSQLADELREQTYEEVRPGDENRVFYKLKTWQKITVMFGGPFMNLVIAAVVMLVMISGVGVPMTKGTEIASIPTCKSDGGPASCAREYPSAASGLKVGDKITSIAGTPVANNVDATRVIRANPGKSIPFVVKREGKSLTLHLTPMTKRVTQLDESGNPVLDGKGQPKVIDAGFAGLSIGRTVMERKSPAMLPGILGTQLKATAGVVLNIPEKMAGVAKAAFSEEKRDPNGPISVVGVSRIAGDVAESPDVALKQKVLLLLNLLASLNLALFVFNLIPLLPLDGGHIAGAIWEALKRPIARARGITSPVYVDATKALPLAYGATIVLIGMSVLLIYADIVKPISFN